jgi:hypothetical protein
MSNSLMMQAVQVIPAIRPFLSPIQLKFMADACRGEEGEFFMQKLIDLAQLIDTMPKTYEQDGKGGDAIVTLHYFLGGSDWYIIEKDMEGGVEQAYGYAVLNGDVEMAECGYISIKELAENGAELDLYFKPCTLREIRGKHCFNAPLRYGPEPIFA